MALFTTDPGTDMFVRGVDAGERARKNREQVSVDTAIRAGLAQQQAAAAPPLSPAPAPPPVSAPRPTAAPATPPPPPPPAPPLAPPAAPEPPGGSGVPDSIPPAAEPPQAAWPPPQAPRPATSAPRAPAPALTPGPSMPTTAASSPYLAPTMRGGAGGDRYGAILQNLSQAPGGGVAALGIMREQDRVGVLDSRRRDQLGRLAMMAFAKGDRVTGEYFARQGGLTLPPQFGVGMGRAGRGGGTGANTRSLAQAMMMAKDYYGNDPEAGKAFIQRFIATGDFQQAFEAGGNPVGKSFKVGWASAEDGKNQYMTHVMPDGRVVPAKGPDGQLVMRNTPGTGAATGRTLNIEAKRAMLIAGGIPEQEASLMAAGGTISPAAKALLIQKIVSDVGKDVMIPEEQRAAEVHRQLQQVEQLLSGGTAAPAPPPPPAAPAATPQPGFFGRIFGGGTPAPAATPQPALPRAQADSPALMPAAPAAPTGTPQRPPSVPAGSAYSASRKQWRAPDGTIFDANGQRQ